LIYTKWNETLSLSRAGQEVPIRVQLEYVCYPFRSEACLWSHWLCHRIKYDRTARF
jgi:hypothetical protein